MILEKIEKLIKKLFWLPFLLGMTGYWLLAGLPFMDSLYASAALYFVNPVVDHSNPVILAAKLLAVIVTTSMILSIVGNVWERAKHFLINRSDDSVCIYGDTEAAVKLKKQIPRSYLCSTLAGKREFDSRDHIFMFSDEKQSLNAYLENRDRLAGKRVFIEVRNINPFLLKDTKPEENIHFFSLIELSSRLYWKRYHFFSEVVEEKRQVDVAFLSYDGMGEAIFRYGYLNNIYSLTQQITYHIWGCSELQKRFLQSLPMENQDRIVIHDAPWEEEIDTIVQMDRVIITSDDSLSTIEELVYRNKDLPIHYYAPKMLGYDRVLNAPYLREFGNLDEVITDENIRNEKLYRQAKLFNYDYCLLDYCSRYPDKPCPEIDEKEMEQQWMSLDGFKKGSNVARADHYWIEVLLEKTGIQPETAWEIEHIRWCRFHRINHWSYAAKRNDDKRKHNLLIPFEELPQNQKGKDGIFSAAVKAEIEKLL